MFPTLLFDDEVLAPDLVQDRALRAASGLAAMGIGDGDVIAVMLRNEPACMEAILAARHLGTYWCGLNWHFKADEAAWILKDSGAKALIVHADLVDQIASGLPPGLPLLVVQPKALTRRMYQLPATIDVPPHALDWDDFLERHVPSSRPALRARGFMPYTSGSTGRPKGVRRLAPEPSAAQAQMQAAAELAHQVFGIDADAHALLAAPMYHSAPASYATFCATAGATLRLEPRFDASRLLSLIGREKVTHLYLVPTMYQRLLSLPEEERSRSDTRSVRFVASTGSPCPASVKSAMIDWWGPVINEAYASSETGYVSFITAQEWLSHPGSVGRPVGKARIRILDDDGNALAPREVGTIYAIQPAHPDFVYANDTEARKRMERDGLVTLGDMGWLSEDGYLHISDRKSDMVISGGVNIYPAEIESVLSAMPGVADCAVFGIPDDQWGEALAAAIEPRAGAGLTEDDVRTFLRARLAGYKVPKKVTFHAALPREETGKIFKRRLRAPHWAASGRNI